MVISEHKIMKKTHYSVLKNEVFILYKGNRYSFLRFWKTEKNREKQITVQTVLFTIIMKQL